MLVERTELSIKEDQEDQFSAAMTDKIIRLLAGVPGVISISFGRGVENRNKFLLLIQWTDMDAHMAYNKAPLCSEIRSLIGPFSKAASMEHFQMVRGI
jgi:quinol monooxygenase YgiN